MEISPIRTITKYTKTGTEVRNDAVANPTVNGTVDQYDEGFPVESLT